MANPFESRKFCYALAGFVAALALALLPNIPGIAPETIDMAAYLMPRVLAGAALLMGGHVLSDETSKLMGLQVAPLRDTFMELLEASEETLPVGAAQETVK
jgi:hypothetical protein